MITYMPEETLCGLSTEKPVNPENGQAYFEIDTGDVSYWDAENKVWLTP